MPRFRRGKIAHAAAAVGLSRQAFYRRLERVGLSADQRTKPEE